VKCEKTGAALTTTCLSDRVYRRGTGSGWPPLGAATGANEPHTQLGLVTLGHNISVSAVDRCLRRSWKASDQAKVSSFGEGLVF